VATSFIRCISTIVTKIANLASIHTISVGTFEITEDIGTRSWTIGAHGHIILIRSIATIVITVTNIVSGDTFEVITLKFVNIVTSKIATTLFRFITSIATIVSSVTKIIEFDAQMVIALVSVFPAPSCHGTIRTIVSG
jgi:hypothetical protein